MSKYLILGSGISGCTAGYQLAEMGNTVEIIEKEARIGGKVLDYCCKATEECSRCGVCVAVSQLHQTLHHPRVRITTGATVKQVKKASKISVQLDRLNPSIDYQKCIQCGLCVDACPTHCISRLDKGELVQYAVDFSSCLLHKGKSCNACVEACPAGALSADEATSELDLKGEAVLIASGHRTYDAGRKIRYGYGRFENVLTGAEAEEILSSRRTLGDGPESVAFIQCVGSRDPKEGNNYCSAVCCSYALRLARILKHNSPESEITIYYIDIQNFDKAFSSLRRSLSEQGVHFVRSIPFRVQQAGSGKLQLLIENMDGEQTEVEHDRVVLSVGMEPADGAEGIAAAFGVEQDSFGFFTSRAATSAMSSDERVFVCGTCHEPMSIPDSMAAARGVAQEIVRAGRLSESAQGSGTKKK